jgi:uncharacterized protein YdaU (DUF1376 family)
MPLFIGDYLGDTAHLTQGQHGAYILLLMHYWQCGPIPCDRMQCYSITRATDKQSRCNADAVLRYFFKEDKGYYRQPRADEELSKAQTAYERRAGAAGKRWAKAKSNSTSKADAMHVQAASDSDSLDLIEPKPSTKEKRITGFVRPTLEQVKAYCKERKNSVDPEAWLAHYMANGFRVNGGKAPMRDWKFAVITWEKNNYPQSNGNSKPKDRSTIFNPAEAARKELDELRSRSDADN